VVWAAAALGHRLDGNLLRGTLALAQVFPVARFCPWRADWHRSYVADRVWRRDASSLDQHTELLVQSLSPTSTS